MRLKAVFVSLELSQGTTFAAKFDQVVVDLKLEVTWELVLTHYHCLAWDRLHDLTILKWTPYHYAKCPYFVAFLFFLLGAFWFRVQRFAGWFHGSDIYGVFGKLGVIEKHFVRSENHVRGKYTIPTIFSSVLISMQSQPPQKIIVEKWVMYYLKVLSIMIRTTFKF